MVKTAEPSDRGDATDDLHGSMKQNILVPRKMRQPVLVLATKVSHSNLHDGNRELLLLLHHKAPLLPSAAGCPALCAGRSATARDQRRAMRMTIWQAPTRRQANISSEYSA
jgi:hypothetical protein